MRSKPNTRSPAVFGNELDAAGFKGVLDRLDGAFHKRLAPLEPRDGVDPHLRRRGQIANAPAESRSCHLALHGQQHNYSVLI
jgi:hypothetical protein